MQYNTETQPTTGKGNKGTNSAMKKLVRWAEADNVADDIDTDTLAKIGEKCIREYEIDKGSRSKWEDTAKKALRDVSMEKESKNYPWPNASNVKYPILAEASSQFNARSYPAIVQDEIVKCKVYGKDPQGMKAARAERVGDYMSYQMSDQIENWEEDTDTLLFQLPIVGAAFRKVFYCNNSLKIRAELVNALDLIVGNNTKCLQSCPRISQEVTYYPHEIQEYVRMGLFIDQDYSEAGNCEDDDAPEEFIEQHRLLDLDGDGYREPWIILVHKTTGRVARIEAGYNPEDIETRMIKGREIIAKIKRKVEYIAYQFLPDPNGGFYGIGFGKLIEGLTETINSALNQMLDAGHLQNAGGGFIGSGLRLKTATLRAEPGRYHTISSSGADIRQSIVNFNHPGPSSVLFQLLGFLENAAKGLTTIQDAMTGEMNRNAPVGTTLALIEQGMKVFNAIYKRVYRALRKEFATIYHLNSRYTDPFAYVEFFDEEVDAYSDFSMRGMDIRPVADPNTVLDIQRISRAQLVLENAKDQVLGPYHNIEAALRHYYDLVRIENTDAFLQTPQPDPKQEQLEQIQQAGEAAKVEKTQAETIKTMAEAEETRIEAETKAFELEFNDAVNSMMPETMQ